MNSLFTPHLWKGERCYVTAQADFLHHDLDPSQLDLGDTCIVVFSHGAYRRIVDRVPHKDSTFQWPYGTTPVTRCFTSHGAPFCIHFPSYGGTRIGNSLEQLAACGIQHVFGLGIGGTVQDAVGIGDIILLEGALRGDGVSRYYAPIEFPAIADHRLTARLREQLERHHTAYHLGLSYGTDALYREEEEFIDQLRELQVLLIDLESSAFLTVGRRLGLRCSWSGVVSDRLVDVTHEGNIHPEHVMETVLQLSGYIVNIIEEACSNATESSTGE
ncbi:MAG: nucleoside phosphorylase [bacterium]|nr:nucleoside phosphorylase [bacterium]